MEPLPFPSAALDASRSGCSTTLNAAQFGKLRRAPGVKNKQTPEPSDSARSTRLFSRRGHETRVTGATPGDDGRCPLRVVGSVFTPPRRGELCVESNVFLLQNGLASSSRVMAVDR
ncbi:hypothetical protein F2P81_000773 [Scophthalmus maximus]|uniref:Uncharacterized protein n=1 Tax=Scophthalmus maximus TaxID=52904 RepID=A0A6A4TU20_SCOMX|nr:hypothetical protein F2P81_000773 [Scophthalmus maximus]